ncbi:hypothetical protein Q5P01_010787 [Channa striata]|uniref:Uncharacterized protein n=1 Tax=Channa striata TaxID=64152 RepID=A0AA88MVT0_CHASR|nr:hypothetical protein Q5P01_010787 [Channa striata]
MSESVGGDVGALKPQQDLWQLFIGDYHRVFCRGLSRDGEQSPARSDPTAPGPPAHKLLLLAGRQHFPR